MELALCFDFGNTRLKCGVFRDGVLSETTFLEDHHPGTILGLIGRYRPQLSILSSVIHHTAEVETVLAGHTRFHKIDHRSKSPVLTPVGKAETIGADRLAIMAAGVSAYPGEHLLAVALGSCIVFNFVDKYAEFLGGSISPGMQMRFRSLHQDTAKLPLVEADWNYPLIGFDTRTNILSGVLLGMAKEVDGVIEAYRRRYHPLRVVLTGGDLVYFADRLTQPVDDLDPDLVFKGIYIIGKMNLG